MKEPNLEWRGRENREGTYKARRLSNDSKTKIEYGAQTWTTGQTVRDLMQNPLDAETERHYKELSALLVDFEKIEGFRKWYEGDKERIASEDEQINKALLAAFMFSKHAEDMSLDARKKSEEFLRGSFFGLPLKKEVTSGGYFSGDRFLEAARAIPEERPHVFYDVVDASGNESPDVVPYETLRDEEKYRETVDEGGEFRYKIVGMKIVDNGSGYDSQLASFYITSKTGKKYLRGKYGEGALMSQLQSLRHGAKIKMRSRYKVRNEKGEDKDRVWQVKPTEKEGEMVSHGVELEVNGSEATGSMTHIDLRNADGAFVRDILANIDPRVGGLANNIVEFDEKRFIYPLPVSEERLVGINLEGKPDEQFVQGIRVESDFKKSGWLKPWFSYDVLDPDVVAGRDRNELSFEFSKKVSSFWKSVQDEKMFARLADLAVKGNPGREFSSGPEFDFLNNALGGKGIVRSPYDSDEDYREKLRVETETYQPVAEVFLKALDIEKEFPFLVMPQSHFGREKDIVSYAERHGYQIKTIAVELDTDIISAWGKRFREDGYRIFSAKDLFVRMEEEEKERRNTVVEGAPEIAAREIFGTALTSLNAFLSAAKLDTVSLEMSFVDGYETSEFVSVQEGSESTARVKNPNIPPVQISPDKSSAILNLAQLPDPISHPMEFQRMIEIYALSVCNVEKEAEFSAGALSRNEDHGTDARMKRLKESQHLLDTVLEDVIPENSPVLAAVPDSLDSYQPSGLAERVDRVSQRLMEQTTEGNATKREKYFLFRKSLNARLSLEEAKELLFQSNEQGDFMLAENFRNRVFLENGILTYYNYRRWESEDLSQIKKNKEWNGRPVYRLSDGRFFIDAPFEEGAVLTKGEGRNREYIINEGDDFLELGCHSVNFSNVGSGSKVVKVQRGGIIISAKNEKALDIDDDAYVQKALEGYLYFPVGISEKGESEEEMEIEGGVLATTIPIEYGRDEWDKPIRAPQDIIQNHADAGTVTEFFEVEHIGDPGYRDWVTAPEIQPLDKIVGYEVSDDGEGYTPENIATMGASRKRSPLDGGKYGEGQKVVAAACFRNGIELMHTSAVEIDGEVRTWKAVVGKIQREVVLDGAPVLKDFVAFNVTAGVPDIKKGSRTEIRLPENATREAERQWSQWLSAIDPREKDQTGNGGMARYSRHLREPGSERIIKVGCMTILPDEPGAVYENGLRVRPEDEKQRGLAYGYDVPQVVSTRERNSYDADRLTQYIEHMISATTDTEFMKDLLEKVVGEVRFKDVSLASLVAFGRTSPIPLWRDAALELWPNGLADYYRTFSTEGIYSLPEILKKLAREKFVEANMGHVPSDRVVVVSEKDYDAFKQFLPTVEDFLVRIKSEIIPISPELRSALSVIVATCARECEAAANATNEQERSGALGFGRDSEKMGRWTDAQKINERETGVRVAPITVDFLGGVEDGGVVLNEELLRRGATKKRQLVETTLHELLHILSGEEDYTEKFVLGLYEMAKYFIAQKEMATPL